MVGRGGGVVVARHASDERSSAGYDIHAMFVDGTARLTNNTKDQPLRAGQASQGLAHHATSTESIRSIFPHEDDVSISHLIHNFTTSEIHPSMPTAAVLPRLIATDGRDASKIHASCLHALAASFFGKMTRNKSISDQEPDCGTLRAVMCLLLYENINVTEPTAWFKHYDGLSKLPSWNLMAWPSGEDAKSSFEVLLDIFAEVPGILHDLDILRLQAGRASIAASALRHRTQTVLQALHTWRGPCQHEHERCALPSDKADRFALAIHHPILLCLSEPSRALLLPLLGTSGAESGPADRFDCGEDTAWEPDGAEGGLAMDICALAHVILRDGGSTALAFSLIFPYRWHRSISCGEVLKRAGLRT
ncbi:hypothetical protein ACCO45_013835 [Purpureocillium lilacinum]|uniref:Uncharacterized protein n=1 Tax=Purpureocillium lilacinum TaxID=33203 RepID=A0ACC4DA22_PURLI